MAVFTVCVYLCVSLGSIGGPCIDLLPSMWGLPFVSPLYLSFRHSLHCHSLTWHWHILCVAPAEEKKRKLSLWPLVLFFLLVLRRRRIWAAHCSLRGHQGTAGWRRGGGKERHLKTGIDLQPMSCMGIEQNSQGFMASTVHVLFMYCGREDC